MLKLAVITDLHHSSRPELGGRGDARPLLKQFTEHAAEWGAGLVLMLGDHITDVSPEADRAILAEVAEALADFPGRRFHVLGNHDVVNLTRPESESILGQPLASQSINLGGLRLILWQPSVAFAEGQGFPPAGMLGLG